MSFSTTRFPGVGRLAWVRPGTLLSSLLGLLALPRLAGAAPEDPDLSWRLGVADKFVQALGMAGQTSIVVGVAVAVFSLFAIYSWVAPRYPGGGLAQCLLLVGATCVCQYATFAFLVSPHLGGAAESQGAAWERTGLDQLTELEPQLVQDLQVMEQQGDPPERLSVVRSAIDHARGGRPSVYLNYGLLWTLAAAAFAMLAIAASSALTARSVT